MACVLVLANHYATLYNFRKELISRLIERGDRVVLSFPREVDNSFFTEMGCEFIETDFNRKGLNPISDFRLIKMYRKIIREVTPDIIFTYTIKPNIYGALANRNTGIRQICNITGTGATFLKQSLLAQACKILYRISVKHVYKVFFQNMGDRDYFIVNKMVGSNYELLPGSGCNLAEHRFSPMPPGPDLTFIFIGRVMKLKGIEEYLECAKVIHEESPFTHFLIAGWNEEEEYMNMVEEAERIGYVQYLGYRDDLDQVVAKCHCTILCSHGGEGTPNVLLESAAMGRICITTNTNGAREVVEDGVTGFIYKKGDAADLINKVRELIHLTPEHRARMGVAGRKKMEKEFDREFVIRKYLQEIDFLNNKQ